MRRRGGEVLFNCHSVMILNLFAAAQKKDTLPLKDSLRLSKKIKHFAVRYRLTRRACGS